MHNSKHQTRIIKRIYSKRKTNNPLLVIYPDGKERWCQSVDIHESSQTECKNGVVTTTTNGHVVTHIALEREDKEKWMESLESVSHAGVKWSYTDT